MESRTPPAPNSMITGYEELIVQSIDLARLLERHVLLMQGTQSQLCRLREQPKPWKRYPRRK
jgi:hypothetical protein